MSGGPGDRLRVIFRWRHAAKAIDYTLKRWVALSRYAVTGHLAIDNNPVEKVIRPIAIGKKNWLFTGSERAGQQAAVIQTLLGTAKLNGIDPAGWLKDTLEKLPTWPYSRLDELLGGGSMNYIHRLTQERDESRAQFQKLQGDLIDLQHYRGSTKFHGIENDWVSAREMWRRVQEIRVSAWEVAP